MTAFNVVGHKAVQLQLNKSEIFGVAYRLAGIYDMVIWPNIYERRVNTVVRTVHE